MSVTRITDAEQHVAIHTPEGSYGVPESLIEDWIAGRAELDHDVARAIMREWLEGVRGGQRDD